MEIILWPLTMLYDVHSIIYSLSNGLLSQSIESAVSCHGVCKRRCRGLNVGVGVLLNCVLLYAIRHFTRKSLGSYKQLLSIFIAFDVFLAILHEFEKPKAICISTTFGYVSNYPDRTITALYSSCFSVPFALMNIHFLYRFWSIRYPNLIPLFSNKKFIAFIATFPIAEFVTWFLLMIYDTTGEGPEPDKELLANQISERYGLNMSEGWIVMSHWENGEFQPHLFRTLVCFDTIMISSFSLASTLGVLAYYHIKRADKISTLARALQQRLLMAVCAQTAVPLAFVYIPFFCVLNFPFLRLPILFIDDVCATMISCFPLWDAVIIMLLMRDYRDGLIGMLRKKKAPAATTVWMTNTSMMPTNSTVTP